MKSDFFGPFLMGIGVGIISVMGLLTVTPSIHRVAKDALVECEKSLPRDQTCMIVAVPKEKIPINQ